MGLGEFQEKEEVAEYLQNIGIEYRFQCYSEKRSDGCHRLGDFLEAIKQDFDKAAVVYQQNCDTHNFAQSCFKFGNYKLLGRGCEQDGETSFRYHVKACENGFPIGCYQAALLRWTGRHGAKQDKPQAQSLFEKGCDAKDSESCYYLSTTFLGEDKNAEVRNDDKEKAFEYSLKACNLNHIYACANLCQLYKHGMGCEKNEELADAAKRKALALRDLYNKKDGGVVFGEN